MSDDHTIISVGKGESESPMIWNQIIEMNLEAYHRQSNI
jgi:hypothetical protein